MTMRVNPPQTIITRTLPDRMRAYTGSRSRTRRAEKVQLLANHLAAWGYSDALAISVEFQCTLRSTENDIRRFRKAGLLKICRVTGCAVPIIIGTDALLVYADASFHTKWNDFPFLTQPSRIPKKFLTHNLLARVAVSAMIRDAEFGEDVVEIIPERLHKRWRKRDHIPKNALDGLPMKDSDVVLILQSGKRVAIELEENEKKEADRQRIIYQYSRLIELCYFSKVFYCGTRRNVLELYKEENEKTSISVWHYSYSEKDWLPDLDIHTKKPLMLSRRLEIKEAIDFEHYEPIAKRYYPYITEVQGAED